MIQTLEKFKPQVSLFLGGVATALLLLGVACGEASTATPSPRQPTLVQVATSTPIGGTGTTPISTVAPTPTPGSSVSPGKVTWMIGSFATERFDNAFNPGGNDYARQIHGFLISTDVKDGQMAMVPGIASKWEISSDGLTWTLTTRKGAKFQDGAEVTVEDVLWTLQHSLGPQAKDYSISGSAVALGATRIEQTGPDQVSVTTKAPAPDFPGLVSEGDGGWVGAVLPRRTAIHDLNEEAAYDRNPIGAGIMRLVKHVPAAQMTLERFADYYYQPKNGFPIDKRVNFTELDLRLVPEEATRVAALRAGDADIAPVSLAGRRQVEAGGGRLVFGQEGVWLDVRQLGCWKPEFPCHDKRVRQALNYAIDKKIMQNQLYGGADVMQVKGWGLVTPSTIGYSPELDPYPYDPDKARKLLADAGYPGGNGFGKLVINTWPSASLPLMPEAAQLGAEYWKRELGLDVEVKVGDEAAIKRASRLTEDLFGQILWRDNEARLDPGDLRSRWGTSDRKDGAHDDPDLLAQVQKAFSIFDPVEQEKALNSIFRRMRDEAYEISLGYVNIPWGVGPHIRTWEPYPLAFYPSALHTITLK